MRAKTSFELRHTSLLAGSGGMGCACFQANDLTRLHWKRILQKLTEAQLERGWKQSRGDELFQRLR